MAVTKSYGLGSGRVKVQVEDLLGKNPGGGWVYQAPGVGNKNAEGAHYFYKSQTAQGSLKKAGSAGQFSFKVNVTDPGKYQILLRAARDTNNPGDARNDIWIKVDGNTQSVMPKGTPTLTSGGNGFVKFKGATTKWMDAHQFSTHKQGDKNPASTVVFDKGMHTITFAPRSTGYHIDSVQVVKVGGSKAATSTAAVAAAELSQAGSTSAAESPVEKLAEKPARTAADKAADKAAEKAVAKPADKAADDKAHDKAGNKAADEKAGDKAHDKAGNAHVDAQDKAAQDKAHDNGQGADAAHVVEVAVAAASDDFESNKAAGSRDLEFGQDGAGEQSVGLRFKGIDLDKDAEIKAAYFVFEAAETSKGAAHFEIEIEDTTEAATFSRANAPDSRTYLADDVDWNPGAWKAGHTYKSADISELIKDVIEEGGADALDALAFRISGSGERVAEAFESGHAPELVIEYA
jgi:hypothetical protein